MFSSRTDWNLNPNPLSQLLEEKRRLGEQILDLTESNPTRCDFSYDPALLGAISSNRALRYEPDPRGLLSARECIAEYYRHKGFRVDPRNIFLTASTSEAYSHLFRLFCNPGETVLVPKPSYPLFDYLCQLNDVKATHYYLRYGDEWYLDSDSLRKGIDPSTRAILLVHPNNPTGSFVKEPERQVVSEIAHHHGCPLIVDEVFEEYQIVPGVQRCGSFAEERGGLTCTLGGISKLLGLPQMKLAWIVLSGEEAMLCNARNRLEIITDTYLSVGTPIQHALPVLFAQGHGVSGQIRTRIAANHSYLENITSQGSISMLKTEGGWNAILRLPEVMSDEAWAMRILKECNVLIHPGHFFEIEKRSTLVISLLLKKTTLSDGFARIATLVHRLFRE